MDGVIPDARLDDQQGIDAASSKTPCEMSDQDGDGFGTDSSCFRIDCDEGNPSIHPDSAEACNGNDDDCDGSIDEGMPMVTCGLGQCVQTVSSCLNGMTKPCVAGDPEPELCNGLDDDCDGRIDEMLSLPTCGEGTCQNTAVCVDGNLEMCQPFLSSSETCDGLDNDCDGATDEDFGAEMHRVAYAQLSMIIDGCSGEGWANRANAACDYAIHSYCREQDCSRSGFGPAENSQGNAWITCMTNADVVATDYPTLTSYHSVCAIDGEQRGPACNAAISRFCRDQGYASGYGPVARDEAEVSVTCVRMPAHHHSTTYSTLTTFHVPCNGTTERFGPNCNAAIKRYCVSLGYRSGFGPDENFGDSAVVTCVP